MKTFLFLLYLCPLAAFNLPVLANPKNGVPPVIRNRLYKAHVSMQVEDAAEQTTAAPVETPAAPVATDGPLFEESGIPEEQDVVGKQKINNMYNEKGVAYAPWMVDSLASSADVAAQERARRDKRQKESNQIFGDVQAQEMAGVGLTCNVNGEDIELKWSTNDETDNEGFIVQKRRAGGANWAVVSSYETFQPLASKGVSGGTYIFNDPTSEPGSWYYRVLDCDDTKKQSFVCQALVEVQSAEEKFGTLFAIGVLGVTLTIATVIGVSLDPQ